MSLSQTSPMPASAPPPAPLWARALAIGAAILCVLALVLSAAVHVARQKVDARLTRLERDTGRRVAVGELELPLFGGLRVVDLRMTAPDGVTPQLVVDEVRTDLDLGALAAGRRRPSAMTVTGLRTTVTIDDEGLHGLEDVLRSRGGGGGGDGAGDAEAEPLEVTLEDAAVLVDLRRSDLPHKRVLLQGLNAVATIASRRSLSLQGTARLLVDGHERGVTLAVDSSRGLVDLELDAALEVPVQLGERRMVVKVRGIRRDVERGVTRIAGLSVRTRGGRADLGSLELRDAGGGLRLDPSDVTSISAKDLVVVRGHQLARAASAELDLDWAGVAGLVPRPRRVAATALAVSDTARGATAQVDRLEVVLSTDGAPTLDPGALLDRVTEIRVTSPTARVTSPGPGEGEGARLPDLRSLLDAAGASAVLGQAGPAKAGPARAGGGARSPGLRARLLARLRTLALDVQDGLVEFVAPDGSQILLLDNLRFRVRPVRSDELAEGSTPAPAGDGLMAVEVDAQVVRAQTPTGTVQLAAVLDEDARPVRARGSIAGRDVAHLLSRFSEYIEVAPDSVLDLQFEYQGVGRDGAHRVKGRVQARDFGFEAWRITHAPVTNLSGEADFDARIWPAERTIDLSLPAIRLGEAKMTGRFKLTRPDKGRPKVDVRLTMPRQDCAAVARSIPKVAMPRLEGLRVKGTMTFDAHLAVDMDNPRDLDLDVDGDMERCQVLNLGRHVNLRRLRGQFVHHPVEPDVGERKDISVGRGTDLWTDSELLPLHVKAAAIVTEDRGFQDHQGIRWQLVERALKLNLSKGRFVYGGSTITQQLVKNLYLTREKTLSRKLEEAIIAMQMERTFTKDEILTLYINVVEYGPDIYGIRRASRWYFGKRPWELSPLEAAFIMGLKPWPRGGFNQWKAGRLNDYWVKRVHHILNMMHTREKAISQLEIDAAAPFQPKFRPKGASFDSGMPYVKPTRLEVLGVPEPSPGEPPPPVP